MGREANKIFKSFTFAALTETDPRDPKDDYDTVIAKFESCFIPKRNIIQERTKFHQRNQAFGELIEHFLWSLHELARYCDFDDKEDENIRDWLIAGMSDKELSQKLQVEQDNYTLQKAVD